MGIQQFNSFQPKVSSFCYIKIYSQVKLDEVQFRSICGEQLLGQIPRIPAWRSTSVGRWTARPRSIPRSIQSIYAREEQ